MAGLGSVCSLIHPWRPLTEFTSNDLNFLQKLNQEKPNQEGGESEEEVAKMTENENNNDNNNNNGNWMEVNRGNLIDDTGAWSDMQENGKGDPNRGILIDDTGAWPDISDMNRNKERNDVVFVDDTGAWPDVQNNRESNAKPVFVDDTGAWPDVQNNRESNVKPVFVDDTGAWPEVERDTVDENTQWYDKTDFQQGSNENEIKDLDKELEN